MCYVSSQTILGLEILLSLYVVFTWQNPSKESRPLQTDVPNWTHGLMEGATLLSAVILDKGNRTVCYFSAFFTVMRTAWANSREPQFFGGDVSSSLKFQIPLFAFCLFLQMQAACNHVGTVVLSFCTFARKLLLIFLWDSLLTQIPL